MQVSLEAFRLQHGLRGSGDEIKTAAEDPHFGKCSHATELVRARIPWLVTRVVLRPSARAGIGAVGAPSTGQSIFLPSLPRVAATLHATFLAW